MRKILSILFFLPFACNGQTYELLGVYNGSTGTPITFTGKTAVFVGDSYMAAPWCTGSVTIPSYFATVTSSTATNLGISGQVLQNDVSTCSPARTVFDQTTIPTYVDGTHSVLFIALGTNDVGVNNGDMTPADFETTLESTITYASDTKGWPLKRIIVVTSYYTAQAGRDLYVGDCGVTVAADATRLVAYVNAAISAASDAGTNLLDIYQVQVDTGSPASLLAGDSLHPNATGADLIATTMATTIFYL